LRDQSSYSAAMPNAILVRTSAKNMCVGPHGRTLQFR
jgi:hypothetical protein